MVRVIRVVRLVTENVETLCMMQSLLSSYSGYDVSV